MTTSEGQKWSKRRPASPQLDRDPASTLLRDAVDDIQRHDFSSGLRTLNSLASTTTEPAKRTSILSAMALTVTKQGDLNRALQIYAQAEFTSNDSRSWLSPAIGQLLILIQDLRTEEAVTKANEIVARAIELQSTHVRAIAVADDETSGERRATFQGQPFRVSDVATRLGNAFLKNGCLPEAEGFFHSSLKGNPNGGSRARLGLAEIAFKKVDFTQARVVALDAISVGKYQAKTLPALELLLKVSTASKTPADVASLLAGYDKSKKGVGNRATCMVIKHLRSTGDPGWVAVANQWLAKDRERDFVMEAELRKLILADLRIQNAPAAERLGAANALLGVKKLGFLEWAFGAKESLRATLDMNAVVNSTSLLDSCAAHFGPGRNAEACHRLGGTAMEADRVDLARSLFSQSLAIAKPSDRVWAMSTWSLARILEKEKNPSPAADLYFSIYSNVAVQQRFRLIGLVAWARAMLHAGRAKEIAAHQQEFADAVARMTDYELILDMAWQLVNTPRELNRLAVQTLARGKELALAVADEATNPTAARKALHVLTRRLSDFGKDQEIIDIWEGMEAETEDWLWSEDSRFWGYVAYVIRSYRNLKRNTDAHALAKSYLEDPATPAAGIAELGVVDGNLFLAEQRIGEAFLAFDKVISVAPHHVMSAYAWYWKSIRSQKAGNADSVAHASMIVLCVGQAPGLYWEKGLRRKGLLLENNLDVEKVVALLGEDQRLRVESSRDSIITDMEKV